MSHSFESRVAGESAIIKTGEIISSTGNQNDLKKRQETSTDGQEKAGDTETQAGDDDQSTSNSAKPSLNPESVESGTPVSHFDAFPTL